MTKEPEVVFKALSDTKLIDVHNKLHGEELNSVTATLHHTLVEEMKSRNIDHENVDCPLHKMVVLKSELVLSKEKANFIVKQQPTSGTVHIDTIMNNRKKKRRKLLVDNKEIEKGDKPGHPFRGNQHTRGGGGGGGAKGSAETTGNKTVDKKLAAIDQTATQLEDAMKEVRTSTNGDKVDMVLSKIEDLKAATKPSFYEDEEKGSEDFFGTMAGALDEDISWVGQMKRVAVPDIFGDIFGASEPQVPSNITSLLDKLENAYSSALDTIDEIEF
jgi:hypothetical protein